MFFFFFFSFYNIDCVMDRRGWPWKKKSSERTGTDKQAVVSDGTSASLSSLASLGDQVFLLFFFT